MAVKAGIIDSDKTKLKFIPIRAVEMRDGFWKTKMDKNHRIGIPKLLEHLESHGVVDNFMIVSGRKEVERQGPYFTDSDLYMETALYHAAAGHGNEALGSLELAVRSGWGDAHLLLEEPLFNPIRTRERFTDIFKRVTAAAS